MLNDCGTGILHRYEKMSTVTRFADAGKHLDHALADWRAAMAALTGKTARA
jgi:hypothetical protein